MPDPGFDFLSGAERADVFKDLDETVVEEVLCFVARVGVSHTDSQHFRCKLVVEFLLSFTVLAFKCFDKLFLVGVHTLLRHGRFYFVAKFNLFYDFI